MFALFGLFCIMTILLLLARVALIQSRTNRQYRLGGRRNRQHHDDTKLSGGMSRMGNEEIRGHMAIRNPDGERINSNVRGGMAHHDVDGLGGNKGGAAGGTRQRRGRLHPQQSELQQPHHIAADIDRDAVHVGMELPSVFENLADVNDLPVKKGVDLPFFWHVPRTGGGTVNDIFGGCLSLTLASDAGGGGTPGKENMLRIVEFSKHYSYVNVDTSTPEGIERARALGLASSEITDIVVSTLLHQASTLFTTANRGRLFAMFRHPVDRAVSLFHFLQDTQWRRRQTFKKELSELTIDEYFKSGLAENNWMTRFLTNQLKKGELTRDDVNLAKEILRRKCLVGLLKEKGESFARFERYFGFPVRSDAEKECHEKKLQWAWPLKHRHEEVEEGSALFDLILSHNMFDMELYEYAQTLFQEQAMIFQ